MTGASDEGRTANLLGALALATAERIDRAARDATGRPGAEATALVILTTVLGGASQDTLGRVLDLTQAGTARLVGRLVRAGLLEQRPGPDGRTRALVPTTDGEQTAHRALQARAAVVGDVLGVLDDHEREHAGRVIERLLVGLTRGRQSARRICRLCDPSVCGHFRGDCPVTNTVDATTEPEP